MKRGSDFAFRSLNEEAPGREPANLGNCREGISLLTIDYGLCLDGISGVH